MVKKLKRIEIEEKLKSLGLLVFTPKEFKDIFGVAQGTVSVFISRNVGTGGIFIKLKNCLYMVKDAYVSPLYKLRKFLLASHVMHLRDFKKVLEQKIKSYLGEWSKNGC